ncbi:SRPBCC family protein [Nocardia wallacei]|uniref:SRPBCC family protein n=1 Tax=Nocardia wallacei TaxID=480035 RepID=UPI002453B139|nr:SRPBCC family protein [Nocardia wallacei]
MRNKLLHIERLGMEYGRIERSMYIDATPEVVYEVISSPEHLKQWWPDEATLDPVPGAVGRLVFGSGTDVFVSPMTVIEAKPPRLFSFRWDPTDDEPAAEGNSLLVTFELTASGSGTQLHMTEVGFRELGWEIAVLEQAYNGHVEGWDLYLPRLVEYAAGLGARR